MDLESLLMAVIGLPEPERVAAIDRFCREHPEEDARALKDAVAEAMRQDGGGALLLSTEERLEHLKRRAPQDGRYTLRGEVARGGMGVILKAYDEDLGRVLAMKLALGHADSAGDQPSVDPRILSRFLDEAQINGQLDHPGVVPVHDLGIDSKGRLYFTMRLVKGRNAQEVFDLARKQKEGWTSTKALEVFLKICDTLAYAHEKGVVHRDLKPTNVMVGRFGEVYVMDWGLAKVLGQEDRRDLRIRPPDGATKSRVRTIRSEEVECEPDSPLVTMDGAVVGTPCYMSPEQAEGRVKDLDERTDIYAVGSCLYYFLTGWQPYLRPGTSASLHTILNAVRSGPPKPVQEIDRTIPAELVAICEKAMARDKMDRYASMQAVAEDLRAYLGNRVVRAYRTGSIAELSKWVKRNRGMAAGILLAAATAIVGLAAVVLVKTEGTRVAKQKGYMANMLAAELSLGANLVGETRRHLEECSEEFRGIEWKILAQSCDVSLATLKDHAEPVRAIAFFPDDRRMVSTSDDKTVRVWDTQSWLCTSVLAGHTDRVVAVAVSPDGNRIVSGSSDGTLRIWDAGSGECLTTLANDFPPLARGLALSPDGQRVLAASVGDSLCVIHLRTGRRTPVPGAKATKVWAIAWLPAGNRFVTASFDNTVRIWDGETLSTLAVLRGHEEAVTSVAVAADGGFIASGSRDRTVRIWDTKSRQCVAVLRGHQEPVYAVAIAPDGSWIASGSQDRTVRIWDATSFRCLKMCRGHQNFIHALAVNADGSRIVSASSDRTLRLWAASAVDTFAFPEALPTYHDRELEAPKAPLEQAFLASSPDGKWLLAARGPLYRFDVETQACVRLSPDEGSPPTGAAVLPDGRRIVCGFSDGTVRILDAETGDVLESIELGEVRAPNVAVTRDGRILVTSADGAIHVWDPKTRRRIRTMTGHSPQDRAPEMAVAADGRRFVTGSWDNTARVWDLESGACLAVLKRHARKVQDVRITPDGRRIFTASGDHSIIMWDAATFEPLATLTGHDGGVLALAMTPDGKRLISGSLDRTVRLWDPESSQCCAVLRGHGEGIRAIYVTPDGKRIVSRGDATLHNWDVELLPSRIAARDAFTAANRQAEEVLDRLLDRGIVKVAACLDALSKDGALPPAVRDLAVRMTRSRGDGLTYWLLRSLPVARKSGTSHAAYTRALRHARGMCLLAPDNPVCLTALGATQFRCGSYGEAAANLERATRERPSLENLSFLAMARLKLGDPARAEEARGLLDALVRKEPEDAVEIDAVVLLAEVETVFGR